MSKVLQRLESRLRQIKAMDRNACDIYTDLAENCPDPAIKQTLRQLAEDETNHQRLEDEMLRSIHAWRKKTP